MFLSALICLPRLKEANLRILMLGNSHTNVNGLPQMLASLLNSDGGRKAEVTARFGAFLDDYLNASVLGELKAGKWDIVILQGAKMSSSHKYRYSQDAPITLAKAAIVGRSKVFWFSEWSRRGWDETAFILGIYGADAKAGGGSLIPVPRAFDIYLKKDPAAQLWSADGNHASPMGSFLAAATIYRWLRGAADGQPKFLPAGLDPALVRALERASGETWKIWRPK